jgi:hypothetical protein
VHRRTSLNALIAPLENILQIMPIQSALIASLASMTNIIGIVQVTEMIGVWFARGGSMLPTMEHMMNAPSVVWDTTRMLRAKVLFAKNAAVVHFHGLKAQVHAVLVSIGVFCQVFSRGAVPGSGMFSQKGLGSMQYHRMTGFTARMR